MGDAFDEAITQVKEIMDKACKKAAKEIGEEIHNTFMKAINDFYNDWPAKKRGYNLQEIDYGVKGKKVYNRSLGNNSYLCGIYVDPSYMNGNPYEKKHGWTFMNPSIAFNLSYLGGIHGFDEGMVAMAAPLKNGKPWDPGTIPKTSTPPDQVIAREFEKYTLEEVESRINKYM